MWMVCVVPVGTVGLAAGERAGLGVGLGLGLGVGRAAIRVAVGDGRGDRDGEGEGEGVRADVALGAALVTTALGVGLDVVVGEAAACRTADGWP
jgi:hypothetical protein